MGLMRQTATTWIFNFVVALTVPLLVVAFTSFGAFAWFGAWNIVLFMLVLCFLVRHASRAHR